MDSDANGSLPDGPATLKIPATPQDINMYGDVFGGWLMSQTDLAGAACAIARARGRVATRAVSEFQFLQPVKVGDLVSLYGAVIATGRTSITVDVQVYVQRNVPPAFELSVHRVAEARIVYVAVNDDGSARRICE